MTTANKITILRILLVPFFMAEVLYYVGSGNELYRLLAILAFAIAAISDGVDGYLARHYNQRSELGAILDPLADKLLLVSGIVLLSLNHAPYFEQIPLWLTMTIIGRDVIILIGLVVIHFTVGKVIVHPRIIGKVATVLQMTVVLWTLLRWDAHWLFIWNVGAAVFTGGSGLLYVYDGIRKLSASPKAEASSKLKV